MTVSVEVGKNCADRNHLRTGDAGVRRYISERAIAQIAIQAIGTLFMAEIQIDPSVFVDIAAGYTATIHHVLKLENPIWRQKVREVDADGSGWDGHKTGVPLGWHSQGGATESRFILPIEGDQRRKPRDENSG